MQALTFTPRGFESWPILEAWDALVARVEALLAERDALAKEHGDAILNFRNERVFAQAAEGRVAVLEAELREQCEMNEQSLHTLRAMLKHWERMGEDRTSDGEPVIEEELRGLIEDLDTSSARAVLAAAEEKP